MGALNKKVPSAALAKEKKNEQSSFETKIRPKVLFFDVNETLLDLSTAKKQIAEVLNGREDLVVLWFTTLLQYSLVTSASGKYEDFGTIGAAALQMVAANNDISISQAEAKNTVLMSLRSLPAHPEVKDALSQLKGAGYRLVAFTNSSKEGLNEQFKNAGLNEYFEDKLSVEEVGKFKPFTDTYAWAAQKMGVQPEESMLIAAHGWDVAGAMWAGWRAAFISRPGQQLCPLAPQTEINQPNLKAVADILITYK